MMDDLISRQPYVPDTNVGDLISRQAAIDAVCERECQELKPCAGECPSIWALESLPSAEPERKKGKWERHYSRPGVFADLFWHCSCCGYKNENQYANVYHKFCPHCGASMERGERDDD